MIVNSIIGSVLVYTLLGLSLEAGAIYTACTALGEFFYHTNVTTPRWIGFFFQRPEMHRIHHQYGRHKNNYGDITWWDMLFGTYENPKEWAAHLRLRRRRRSSACSRCSRIATCMNHRTVDDDQPQRAGQRLFRRLSSRCYRRSFASCRRCSCLSLSTFWRSSSSLSLSSFLLVFVEFFLVLLEFLLVLLEFVSLSLSTLVPVLVDDLPVFADVARSPSPTIALSERGRARAEQQRQREQGCEIHTKSRSVGEVAHVRDICTPARQPRPE